MLINPIRYFHAVVKTGSFTRAAKECSLSQSAISQQIQALENELGTRLLIRKRSGLELTEAGRYFYQKSVPLLQQLDELVEKTARLANQAHAPLRIGILRGLQACAIENALLAFSKEHPAVLLNFEQGNHEELYEGLRSNRLDLAISDQRRAFSQHYCNDFLLEVPFEIEVRTDHPLSDSPAEVNDMQDEVFVLIAPSSQEETERDFWKDIVGISGPIRTVDSLELARMQVLATNQIFLSEFNDLPASPALARRPLLRHGKPLMRRYYAFWKKDNSGYFVEDLAEKLEDFFKQSLNKKN